MSEKPALTKNQARVYAALVKAGRPLKAYGLLEQLRGAGFRAPLQIYRALDRLLQLGLVHKIESVNGFMACAQQHTAPHKAAFAICDQCGEARELTGEIPRRWRNWAAKEGFNLERAVIELAGRCRGCDAA